IATTNADQARVLAETLSQAKQAEALRDLDIKKATYAESVKRQQAQADKSYDIQTSIMQQQLIAESVKVQQIEKEAQIKVQDAEAYQEWKQAAVVDKLITNMPEVVRALAAPLANVDKITIISTGNTNSSGMHQITGDMAAMAAQIPALFETLSGMKMSDLFDK